MKKNEYCGELITDLKKLQEDSYALLNTRKNQCNEIEKLMKERDQVIAILEKYLKEDR